LLFIPETDLKHWELQQEPFPFSYASPRAKQGQGGFWPFAPKDMVSASVVEPGY
jgi:hypothetical protein